MSEMDGQSTTRRHGMSSTDAAPWKAERPTACSSLHGLKRDHVEPSSVSRGCGWKRYNRNGPADRANDRLDLTTSTELPEEAANG